MRSNRGARHLLLTAVLCCFASSATAQPADLLESFTPPEGWTTPITPHRVIGNLYAIYKNRKGEKPKDEEGDFRPGRAYWLLGVGTLIALWGGISLIA